MAAKHEGYIYKPAKVEATDQRIQSLNIPQGFTIQKFADQLGNPRMLAVREDGKVYVTDRNQGVIYLLEDADKDGKAESPLEAPATPAMSPILKMLPSCRPIRMEVVVR